MMTKPYDDADDKDDYHDHKNDSYTVAGAAPGASVPCSSFRLPASGPVRSGFWLPASGFRLPASGFRLPVPASSSGFRFRLPASGFQLTFTTGLIPCWLDNWLAG